MKQGIATSNFDNKWYRLVEKKGVVRCIEHDAVVANESVEFVVAPYKKQQVVLLYYNKRPLDASSSYLYNYFYQRGGSFEVMLMNYVIVHKHCPDNDKGKMHKFTVINPEKHQAYDRLDALGYFEEIKEIYFLDENPEHFDDRSFMLHIKGITKKEHKEDEADFKREWFAFSHYPVHVNGVKATPQRVRLKTLNELCLQKPFNEWKLATKEEFGHLNHFLH